jgi:putative spermidine/putrescine transport system substrate-binding protein
VSSSGRHLNRRDLLKKGALGGLGLAGLGPLSGLLESSPAFAAAVEATTGIDPMLVSAAKKEGHLNVITLPRTWANYGELMDTFGSRYGISLHDDFPEGSSSYEITSIKNLKGQSRGPDVVDVSPAWASAGAAQGLFTPYKVATWNTIPSSMKDPTGLWYGDYYGVIAFLSRNDLVKQAPKDWSDLLSPKLKGMVALGDDPRKAGEAFAAVMAASLANGGSLDNIQPGIDFFAKLKKAGNFILAQALNGNVAKGVTPVAIRWDYLLLAVRDVYQKNFSVTVNIPKTGRYAGPYFQAISKYAPNPNAAKLWEEFLYSDEGQLLFLKGYTHPARYADLAKRGKIPMALAAKLPAAENYSGIKFATVAQINAAQKVLTEQWGPKVAGS